MTPRSSATTRRSFAITRSPEPDGTPKGEDLFPFERAEMAAGEAAELERAERDPLEASHAGADARKQPPDLAVLALGERDRDQGEVAVAAVLHALQHPHRLHAGALRAALRRAGIREEYSLREPRYRARRELALHRHAVFLGNPGARMRQAVGELAVVRQEHEAGGIRVEAADGVDALAGRHSRAHEIDDVCAPAGIARGGDHALRLVEHQIEPLATQRAGAPLEVEHLAVELDQVARRVDQAGQLQDAPAVDADPAGADGELDVAARGESRAGEDFLQALATLRGRGRRDAVTKTRVAHDPARRPRAAFRPGS